MQKTPLSSIIWEEILRALIFGIAFFIILTTGLVGVANAANGGLFGDVLNKILASWDWMNPGDGTVKNANQLDGQDSSNFIHVGPNRSCGVPQCIYGFDAVGNVLCR